LIDLLRFAPDAALVVASREALSAQCPEYAARRDTSAGVDASVGKP
jgi:hypothetical protein